MSDTDDRGLGEISRQLLLAAGRRGVNCMDIRHEVTESKGRYTIQPESDGPAAVMTYSRAGTGTVIIDHTEVPDTLRGQGFGVALVSRAVDDARASGKSIIPLCPYAAAQFRRHPEWSDVLKTPGTR